MTCEDNIREDVADLSESGSASTDPKRTKHENVNLHDPDNDQLDNQLEDEDFDLDDEELPEVSEDTDSEERAAWLALAADAVRAEDIKVLDLRGLTIIADFFVICTGKSSIQLRAIADRAEEIMEQRGYKKLRVEGYQEAVWILLDYGDVVMHIMAAEQREFYHLEDFWKNAPLLPVDLDNNPFIPVRSRPAI